MPPDHHLASDSKSGFYFRFITNSQDSNQFQKSVILIGSALCFIKPYIVILRYDIIMGITKSELFKKRQNKIANLAKAFDHPARVAIIEHLLTNNTCICNDLVDVLPLSQSTITQHLKELKRIGIIKGEIEGPKVNYCIDEQVWEEAKDIFINLFTKYVKKNDCC